MIEEVRSKLENQAQATLRQQQVLNQQARQKKIALEMSDLVVYCRPVPFQIESESCDLYFLSCDACFTCTSWYEIVVVYLYFWSCYMCFLSCDLHSISCNLCIDIAAGQSKFYHMSSFVETRLERIAKSKAQAGLFISYSNKQLSRTYPKGQRLESSNLDPLPMWNAGCQMVALNYQTGG